jgi:hypothetical protein
MAQWKEWEVRVWKKVGKHHDMDHFEEFDTYDLAYARMLDLLKQGVLCDVVHA